MMRLLSVDVLSVPPCACYLKMRFSLLQATKPADPFANANDKNQKRSSAASSVLFSPLTSQALSAHVQSTGGKLDPLQNLNVKSQASVPKVLDVRVSQVRIDSYCFQCSLPPLKPLTALEPFEIYTAFLVPSRIHTASFSLLFYSYMTSCCLLCIL